MYVTKAAGSPLNLLDSACFLCGKVAKGKIFNLKMQNWGLQQLFVRARGGLHAHGCVTHQPRPSSARLLPFSNLKATALIGL